MPAARTGARGRAAAPMPPLCPFSPLSLQTGQGLDDLDAELSVAWINRLDVEYLQFVL